MTEQQKTAIQEEAEKIALEKRALNLYAGKPSTPEQVKNEVYLIINAMTEVITNPGKYGLVESSVMETNRKLRLRICEHEAKEGNSKAENQRYKEALEWIRDVILFTNPPVRSIHEKAQQALKGGDQ